MNFFILGNQRGTWSSDKGVEWRTWKNDKVPQWWSRKNERKIRERNYEIFTIRNSVGKYFWNVSNRNVPICLVIEIGLRELNTRK